MVRGGRFAERRQMATDAFSGETEAIELANSANFMARVTIHRCVSADQRKPVLMLINVVNGNLPAVGIVTKRALRAVFAAMKVRVAILTFLRSIAEDESLVAIGTLHFSVTAAQGEFRLRVVELEFDAQRLPALRGVAILARDRKSIAVRAAAVVERDVLSERNTPD